MRNGDTHGAVLQRQGATQDRGQTNASPRTSFGLTGGLQGNKEVLKVSYNSDSVIEGKTTLSNS